MCCFHFDIHDSPDIFIIFTHSAECEYGICRAKSKSTTSSAGTSLSSASGWFLSPACLLALRVVVIFQYFIMEWKNFRVSNPSSHAPSQVKVCRGRVSRVKLDCLFLGYPPQNLTNLPKYDKFQRNISSSHTPSQGGMPFAFTLSTFLAHVKILQEEKYDYHLEEHFRSNAIFICIILIACVCMSEVALEICSHGGKTKNLIRTSCCEDHNFISGGNANEDSRMRQIIVKSFLSIKMCAYPIATF